MDISLKKQTPCTFVQLTENLALKTANMDSIKNAVVCSNNPVSRVEPEEILDMSECLNLGPKN